MVGGTRYKWVCGTCDYVFDFSPWMEPNLEPQVKAKPCPKCKGILRLEVSPVMHTIPANMVV